MTSPAPRQLSVNGELKTVTVPDGTPLLWAVREECGLTGTKFGCGMGLCGACTVHINGAATRSCVTPVEACGADAKITTIEGLAHGYTSAPTGGGTDTRGAVGAALINAWIRHNVPQCGYCQSGQLMSAASLLAQNLQPSDAEIDAAMSGNICRCGTYPRIRAAILDAAAQLHARQG